MATANGNESGHTFESSIQIARILKILADTIKNTEIVVSIWSCFLGSFKFILGLYKYRLIILTEDFLFTTMNDFHIQLVNC